MSLHDLIEVASSCSGVPGLDLTVSLMHSIYSSAENVKIYRQQLRDISNRAVILLLALRDATAGMGSSEALRAADEVESAISRIHSRVQQWVSWSKVRSFVNQGEIKDGIDKSYRDIETCLSRFNMTTSLDIVRGQQDLAALQERDRVELRETLQSILKNTDDLKTIVNMKQPEVEGIMQSIQEELLDLPKEEELQPALRQGLWELHRQTTILPPMIDLTGQIVKASNEPVICGVFNDIYMGIWLDEERVALRYPRALINNPVARLRFLKDVEVARSLQHPNVTRLYGICYFGDHVYAVSKWMDNGNAITYVQSHPDVDRLRIISEVASGMEYLHSHNIVHGDLRGANVLISQAGKACLSDFGISKYSDPMGQESSSGSFRWLAPELFRRDAVGKYNFSVSTATDVWSFGMLCLEIMTGKPPFTDVPVDIHVAFELSQGKLPERPGREVTARGLSDNIWSLIESCWKDPDSRPSMTQVKQALRRLRDISASGGTPDLQSHPLPPLGPLKTVGDQQVPAPHAYTSSPVSKHPSSSPNTYGEMIHSSPNHGKTFSSASNITSKGSQDELLLNPGSNIASSSRSRSSSQLLSPIFDHKDGRGKDNASPPQLVVHRSWTTTSRPVEEPSHLKSGLSQIRPMNITASRSGSMGGEYVTSDTHHLTIAGPSSLPTNFGSHVATEQGRLSIDRTRSSSTSVSSDPIDVAVADPESVIHYNSDGSVEAGTLEGLVDRLIKDSIDFASDMEYRKVFMTTYPAFTTSDNVFNMLTRRFRDAGPQADKDDIAVQQHNVIIVMKQWLLSRYAQVNIDVLSQMRDLCSSARMDVAKVVISLIDNRINALQDPHLLSPTIPSSSPRTIPKAADITPRDLAVALSILEGDLYKNIIPADYIAYLRHLPGGESIDAACNTNNTIVNWVKKSILRSKDIEPRGEVLKFFVNTAQECYSLRNFASMTAIVAALDSSAVNRLRLTRSRLKKNGTQILQRLVSLMNPEHNHRAYRTALAESRRICIPWLAVHLRDLNTALARGLVVEIGGRPLIHFKGCIRFSSRLEALVSYQQIPNLAQHRDAGPLDYLTAQLRAVPVYLKIDDTLEALSLDLEAREREMHEWRTLELRALGFST